MKKRGIIFVSIVIMVAVLFYLYGRMANTEYGKTVTVTVDGNVYGEYALDEEQVIKVSTSYGMNVLHIQNRTAYVTDSDCADHICEKTGTVSHAGEVICCLPHRFLVEIR